MADSRPDPDDDLEEGLRCDGDADLAEPVAPVATVAPEAAPATNSALLITYGIIAGAYLLYTVGWVVSVQRYNATVVTSPEPLNAFMFGLGQILAMVAPALWFAASLLLTRGRKPIIRLLVLLAGLVATLPWPFILGVWQ